MRLPTEHPKITYPKDHQLGMVVPKGGSSCAKCEYVRPMTGARYARCENKLFQKWQRDDVIPAPADEYCCDLYSAQMPLRWM